MADKKIFAGLICVICFQILILGSVYLNAVYPLWTGKSILLKTVPIDPRSMFRGNYARLRYDISQIPAKDVNHLLSPRHGEVIYVKLAPGKNNTFRYDGVSIKKPSAQLFLKGRIQSGYHRTSGSYRVRYGIEAFFAPKAKALALEKTLRHTAVAKIYVAKNGKAALKEVIDGSDG